jgi:glycosyltransferase involved in cell wall biosynthesis
MDIKINYNKYNIIYGTGKAMEEAFYYKKGPYPICIFYANGCNPLYSNIITTLKVRDFYTRHGYLLIRSSRIIKQSQYAQILLADAVIVLGNKFVLGTYTSSDQNGVSRYRCLNSFYRDIYDIDLSKKDFGKAKKNFLWFGSVGLLHKGLDILLDIFSKRDDIFLHICGAPADEIDFWNCYKQSFQVGRKNIVHHGFVNIQSDLFKEIMECCAYIVSPSVSEGGASGILTAIANGGMIPIISESTGLDMDNFGWVIEKIGVGMFEEAISQAAVINDETVKEKAMNVKAHVRKLYSYELYKKNLGDLINKIADQSLNNKALAEIYFNRPDC